MCWPSGLASAPLGLAYPPTIPAPNSPAQHPPHSSHTSAPRPMQYSTPRKQPSLNEKTVRPHAHTCFIMLNTECSRTQSPMGVNSAGEPSSHMCTTPLALIV